MADTPVVETSDKIASEHDDQESLRSKKSEEVNFSWQEEVYRLPDLTSNDQLPRVVQIQEEDIEAISPGLRQYLRQPVLLDHSATKKDYSARTVYRDKTNGKYFEVGQTLIIPETYEGWFELVPDTYGRAGYFSNIGEVAKALPKRFFTRTAINAVSISRNAEGQESYKEKKIPAGAILKTDDVFKARWKTQTKSGLFKSKEKEYVTQEIHYLRCKTPDRKEIMVAFQESGKFNSIYERTRKDEKVNAIYRLKDLTRDFKLPLMVRLLYGKAPVVPCIFTGLLMLKSASERETIIASTMVNKRNVLFEIPVDTQCNVFLPSDDNQFDVLHTFKDAKRLCRKYGMPFESMIKLSNDMDTNHEMIEHKPRSRKQSQTENLNTLDLIKDMNIGESEEAAMFDSDGVSQAESNVDDDGKVLELIKDDDKKAETLC